MVMRDLIETYLKYLENHPEEINSIILWNLTMSFVYYVLIKYRNQMLEGAKSGNKLFESNEQVIFLLNMVWPGFLSYSVYFSKPIDGWSMSLVAGIIGYTIGGRWIFEWALAFKSGKSKVEE